MSNLYLFSPGPLSVGSNRTRSNPPFRIRKTKSQFFNHRPSRLERELERDLKIDKEKHETREI